MGRMVGGVIAAAFSLGESIAGIALIIGSIAGGGVTTVMSGGTLVIAGASVSMAGVSGGAVMVADGASAAGRAACNEIFPG